MEVLPHGEVVSLGLVHEHLRHAELGVGGVSRPEHRRLSNGGVQVIEESEHFPERKCDSCPLQLTLEQGRVDSLSQE